MANDKRHLLHIKSSVEGKKPTKDDLYYGEFAINYFKDAESVYIKNSQDEIIKLNDSNSITYNDSSSSLTEVISAITSMTQGLENVVVNNVSGTIESNVASVEIFGKDIDLSNQYQTVEYPAEFTQAQPIAQDDDTETAFNKVETTVSSLVQEVLDNEEVTEGAIEDICEGSGLGMEIGESGVVITYNTDYVKNTNYISGATSLANADVLLDNAIKNVDNKIQSLTLDTDNVIVGAEFTPIVYQTELINEGGINVAVDDTTSEAINKIEVSISALTQAVLDDEEVLMNSVKEICEGAGLGVDSGETGVVIEYNADYNKNTNYIKDATSLANADVLLDATIKATSNSVSSLSNNFTSFTEEVEDTYVHKTGDTMTGSLTVEGDVTSTGAIYSSDAILKENVKTIEKSDLDKIAEVDLKSYNFIDDTTHRKRYGVIAQHLESVGLENLVLDTEKGTKGVDYISLLILKIAQLEAEIKELKNK